MTSEVFRQASPLIIQYVNDLDDQGWEALALNDDPKIQKCPESVQTNELIANFFFMVSKYANSLSDGCDALFFEKWNEENPPKINYYFLNGPHAPKND
jgi:hypothetical protein